MYSVYYKKLLSVHCFRTESREEALELFRKKKTCLVVFMKKEYLRRGKWGESLAMLFGQAFEDHRLSLPGSNMYCIFWYSLFQRFKFITRNREIAYEKYKYLRDDKGAAFSKYMVHNGTVLKKGGWNTNYRRSAIGEMYNMRREEYNFDPERTWTVYYKQKGWNVVECEDKFSEAEAIGIYEKMETCIVVNNLNVCLKKRKEKSERDYCALFGQAYQEGKLKIPFSDSWIVLWTFVGGRSKFITFSKEDAEKKYKGVMLSAKWLFHGGKIRKKVDGIVMSYSHKSCLGELWTIPPEQLYTNQRLEEIRKKNSIPNNRIPVSVEEEEEEEVEEEEGNIKREFLENEQPVPAQIVQSKVYEAQVIYEARERSDCNNNILKYQPPLEPVLPSPVNFLPPVIVPPVVPDIYPQDHFESNQGLENVLY